MFLEFVDLLGDIQAIKKVVAQNLCEEMPRNPFVCGKVQGAAW